MHTEKNVNLVYMFRGHIHSWSLNLKKSLKKNIQLKKENQIKAQKRKAGQEEKNFALISKLLSDGEVPVKKLKVNVVKSSIFKRDTSLLATLIELVHY